MHMTPTTPAQTPATDVAGGGDVIAGHPLIWCQNCGERRSIRIAPNDITSSDILCRDCYFVIATTFATPSPGDPT